jgi:hypothetical protein
MKKMRTSQMHSDPTSPIRPKGQKKKFALLALFEHANSIIPPWQTLSQQLVAIVGALRDAPGGKPSKGFQEK